MELLARLWKRRGRAYDVAVRRAEARLDDPAAVDRLLAPLPDAESLKPRLRAVFFARAWDAQTQRDYWVASDAVRVVCFTVCGLTLQQAAEVRVRWDAVPGRAELTEEALADLIAAQTGSPVTLIG